MMKTIDQKGKSPLLWAILIAIVLVVGAYCWNLVSRYNRGIPEKPTVHEAQKEDEIAAFGSKDTEQQFAMNRISPEEINRIRNEILSKVDLTDDQKERIQKMQIPRTREQIQQGLQEFATFMSPEQIQVFRSAIRATVDEKIEEVMKRLSTEDQESFKKRIEQRRKELGVLNPPKTNKNS